MANSREFQEEGFHRRDGERSAPLWADAIVLTVISSVLLALVAICGNGYGFHRDELQFLDDARHMQAGFVAYPPLTSLAARSSIDVFGISVWALRLVGAMANMVSLILVGLTAREMGGLRVAQALALLTALPVGVAFSSFFNYNTFDYVAWALTTFFCTRLLRTENEKWWIGVGVGIGVGVLSKYSIAFLVASLVIGIAALPSQRHRLRSKWLYLGAGAALLVASPNLLWLATHHFVTLRMEQHIHARDIRMGRAAGFFGDQLKYTMFALPLVVAGMVALVRSRRFRLLSFFFFWPLVFMALAKGRGYYLLPAYVPVYAAAAVALERWVARKHRAVRIGWRSAALVAIGLNMAVMAAMFLPIATPGSRFFFWQARTNFDIGEEIGWPEFVDAVANAYHSLPPSEHQRLAILAEDYGEAGALTLYGPQHALPPPISEVNSFHDRGYGPFAPENVLITGSNLEDESKYFANCRVVGRIVPPYGLHNLEFLYGREILLCSHPRFDWTKQWPEMQSFG